MGEFRITSAVGVLFVLLISVAVAAEPAEWTVAAFDGEPVEIVLPERAALDALLRSVPIASFHREQISPGPGGGLIFRPRVTGEEIAALEQAGIAYRRLEDTERKGRRAVEIAWSAQAHKSSSLIFPLTAYPTHGEIGALLGDLVAANAAICDTFIWGASVQGRELWGIRISADVESSRAEPEVRLSSSMHGNEVVGMVMLLNLAEHLVTQYDQPGFEDVTALVDETEIHILPLHNPDGYAAGTRQNANDKDLNRDFIEPNGSDPVLEVENVRFIEHALDNHFVVSLNGHGGALVVNYPWDWTYDLAPDDAALQLLSLEYSTRNLPMYNGVFSQGITNGAQWYVADGTLQDWSYDQTDCIDVTLEMSNDKWPPASTLDDYWDDNRESLLAYIRTARFGIGGVVTDATNGQPLEALVTVTGNVKPVTTDPVHGDYYKLLPTGTFELTFTAQGYLAQTIGGVSVTWGTVDVLDVALEPDSADVPEIATVALTAHPNPFNPRTTFLVTTPQSGQAELAVFDLRGRRVRTLLAGPVAAGTTPVAWDGRTDSGLDAGAGAYLGRLAVDGNTFTTKVMLVR